MFKMIFQRILKLKKYFWYFIKGKVARKIPIRRKIFLCFLFLTHAVEKI